MSSKRNMNRQGCTVISMEELKSVIVSTADKIFKNFDHGGNESNQTVDMDLPSR